MLSEIGKIKVGAKKNNGNGREYPVSLDHFVGISQIQEAQDSFDLNYDKANVIPVCFASDNDSYNIVNRYEVRDSSGKLYAYGDGKDFYIAKEREFTLIEHETILSKYQSVENFQKKISEYLKTPKHEAPWKEMLKLRFIIAKISILGVWTFTTYAAKSSIDQILSSYDMIKLVNGGSVKMIPFLLNVKKVVSNRSQSAMSYPVVSLNGILPEEVQNNLIDSDTIEAAKQTLKIEE